MSTPSLHRESTDSLMIVSPSHKHGQDTVGSLASLIYSARDYSACDKHKMATNDIWKKSFQFFAI